MFHPAVQHWFDRSFDAPTPVQTSAWEAIRAGDDVLIAAPTGSGKTFAAFLCAIDDLVTRSEGRALEDGVRVLYVSPLKALSNDIEKNLQAPLAGIDAWLSAERGRPSGIRAGVRTGDTTPGEREQMRRRPPQILVTTPESLYLLLTSASGRAMLATVQDVIVDEIHAVAGSKRGSHLSLSLARLDALLDAPARRIGLSATQKPIETIAGFLTSGRQCAIVDTGHQRERDIRLELPSSPLSPVMANEVWEEVYNRLEALISEHRTTLIFVNTRRLAERLARHLAERLGEEAVTAHHGSLSRTHRLAAEQALKSGQLRALVATASLELGIDIGHVDLVCQIGSPGSISAFIQRVGRAGHAVGATPKGRLFPCTRDDLIESIALLRAVREGLLDRVHVPAAPLDVLAQQIVAEVSAAECGCDELYAALCRAWPYRALERQDFDRVVGMLSSGYTTRRGRRGAFVHHDAVNGRLRPRPGARLTALQNGGAIPDQFDYDVVMQPQGFRVGTLNEDFAFESLPGDIFQLGNTSYRILKIEQGRVLVEDARGLPPTIPFWFGERPGRSDELSGVVSALRSQASELLDAGSTDALRNWLAEEAGDAAAAEQAAAYLTAVHDALGVIPSQENMVLERFFDDTGDMHLVIHAPLGSRIMRAWGLALRKRFCRHFNFELQAAALEDCLILSLGETHSFENDSIPEFLKSATVRDVLVQALLDAPLFEVRWRWNATIALAVQRMRNGRKLPPQWQRNQAEDLIAVVFPDQLACLENVRGEREVPDHPLVRQTVSDCLEDSMDIDGLERVLAEREQGIRRIRCLDLTGPSPLAAEIINARPYAFLDDGDAENRRTRAIRQQPDDLGHAATLSIISVSAVEQVQGEAWISPRNADELHDGLVQLGFLTADEFAGREWKHWYQALADDWRACCVRRSDGRSWWVATERLHEFLLVGGDALAPTPDPRSAWAPPERPASAEAALIELLRARLSGLGPVSAAQLAEDFGLPVSNINAGLVALQNQGFAIAMAGEAHSGLWCERRLLARIHRYSREHRRQGARPVPPAAYMRFLADWHGLHDAAGDIDQALGLLEGWVAPLAAWERPLLSARCRDYAAEALDQCFLSGRSCWFRPAQGAAERIQIIAATPIAIVPRTAASAWRTVPAEPQEESVGGAGLVLDLLRRHGAMFTDDLQDQSGLLRPELEQSLATLVARGLVSADAYSPLRWLIRPEHLKRRQLRRAGRGGASPTPGLLGRWSAVPSAPTPTNALAESDVSTICAALLRRYGVVFRAVLERESLLPPWRDLLRYLRRMEDRGEVHGGRFVDGFSGEQFAVPEAVGVLRRHAEPGEGLCAVIGGADPLNLGGILTPGARTPATNAWRILLYDGQPAARAQGQDWERLDRHCRLPDEELQRRLLTVRPLQRERAAGH